ncbi:hypothetical protein EU524_00610 [Candidatus Thorarchaeota archaeon]|nr:MAG: hypothetical protein EU524_00610 [Candidatus Thorarchaeota archaeon]
MSSKLADVLESVVADDSGVIDLTRTMEMIYTNSDRAVLSADLLYLGDTEAAYMEMRIGLRSEILVGFPTYFNVGESRFRTADIPSLVPLVAIIASRKRHRGIHDVQFLVNEDSTHVVVTFIGKPDQTKSSLSNLASSMNRVMDRWNGWCEVLLSILDRDPVLGEKMTGVDWREFLAGEGGYVTMAWFRPMTYAERANALDSIVTASRALLASFLSPHEMKHEEVQSLQKWLSALEPQPHVISGNVEHVTEVAKC